jgi:hypothetical protein
MGTSTRPSLLPFLRHDDLASCRSDFEHHRREGFPVYSLKRDEKRQELLDLLVADHAEIIDAKGTGRGNHAGVREDRTWPQKFAT